MVIFCRKSFSFSLKISEFGFGWNEKMQKQKKTWENQLSKKPENYTSIEEHAQHYSPSLFLGLCMLFNLT